MIQGVENRLTKFLIIINCFYINKIKKIYEKKRRRRYKMTAYESLKRKENVLREASLRAEAPDMKSMWFEKSRELRKKINEMTIEEAEKEELF